MAAACYFVFRMTALLGVFLSAASMAGCMTTNNFVCFQLLYGFMMGTGMAFLYMPAATCSTFYFIEKQSLAIGIACSGAMMGYAIFPPAHWLIFSTLHKEGVFVFNAGLLFCLVPAICMFFPTPAEVDLRSAEITACASYAQDSKMDRRRQKLFCRNLLQPSEIDVISFFL